MAMTYNQLEKIATNYLNQYAASAENLRQVLIRRIRREQASNGMKTNEGLYLIEKIILQFKNSGILDDKKFALARIKRLHDRGMSSYTIKHELRRKGVGLSIINSIFNQNFSNIEAFNLSSAIHLARRKKLGLGNIESKKEKWREKEIAKFVRAGFSYKTTVKVIDAENLDELEDEIKDIINLDIF